MSMYRSSDGKVVHRADCAVKGNGARPWYWSDSLTVDGIWRAGMANGLKFCSRCDPVIAADKQLWYDMSGRLISTNQARDLMEDFEARLLANTNLDFMGHRLKVLTAFVPVDHGETHGTYTPNPACWLTEILGGPPDLDGTKRASHSREEALELHNEVVEYALAGGCVFA